MMFEERGEKIKTRRTRFDKIRAEIERKFPHLRVLKTGINKYGSPIALVQVADRLSPVYGCYAVMKKIKPKIGRPYWSSTVRTTKREIAEKAFDYQIGNHHEKA